MQWSNVWAYIITTEFPNSSYNPEEPKLLLVVYSAYKDGQVSKDNVQKVYEKLQ